MPISNATRAAPALAGSDPQKSSRLAGTTDQEVTTPTTISASLKAVGIAAQMAASLRKQLRLGDLHEEAEDLRDELARDWVFAPQAEFDRLVSDICRWSINVGGLK